MPQRTVWSLRTSRVGVAMLLAMASGCKSDGGTGTVDPVVTIAPAEGSGQTSTAGQAVAVLPAVRVDRNGAAASGVVVTFAVTGGGGSVTGATATTNASGIARVGSWTLGTTAGSNTLTATAAGSTGATAVFTAAGIAGPAAAIAKQSGDAQTVAAGTSLTTRPTVRVTDQFNNPVSGVSVSFAVTQGGGTLSGGGSTNSVTTDASGLATVAAWAVGTTVGVNTVSATVGSLSPVVFTVTATSGAPSIIAKIAGDAQTGTVGQTVPVRPSVKVTDQFGNAVSGVAVTFTPTAASGAVTGATQTTAADGVATVSSWTLGNTAGAQSLNAGISVLATPATFTATARAAAAATVVKVTGDLQNVAAGTNVPAAVTIRVNDPFGNGVSGIPVTFAVTQGGGTLTGAAATTGTDGTATLGSWKLGNAVGANALTATITSASALTGNPATFTATGVVGPAAILTKQAGDNQSGVAGSQLTISPSVKLTDQFGNVVTGSAVTFALASGGGTISGANPLTNASGVATLGSWTLGAAPGANTVTASVGSINVVFSATALAALNAAQYAGNYAGTWTNTTFGSTDVATANIVVNAQTSTATLTASANGNVLGSGPVPPTARATTYSATSGAFVGNVPQMGDINGTVTATANPSVANIQATGTNVPNPGISRWTVTGTITPTQINLTFTVFFTSGAPAIGTIVLNKTG